jgi:hypothetical protein
MGRQGARCFRPAIAFCKPILRLPALQRAHINSGQLAGLAQARAIAVRHINHLGHVAAIFQSDHSSSPLGKIASSFF